MAPFDIFSDSACDLHPHIAAKNQITLIPFYVSLDGKNYFRENVDITLDAFYDQIRDGKVFPKTSQPSIQDYMDYFTPSLEAGRDVLCFCLTAKFSGSYQSAVNAQAALEEVFPDRSITLINSGLASICQGQLVLEAARMQQAGKTLEEVAAWAEAHKSHNRIWVTVDSLTFLQQGGRIGKVSAFAGSLLDIKPIIHLTDGELAPYSKVRGRKKAVATIVDICMKHMGHTPQDYRVVVGHSDCLAEAEALQAMVTAQHGITFDLPPAALGTTIAAHIGPTVLGLSCMKKFDANS